MTFAWSKRVASCLGGFANGVEPIEIGQFEKTGLEKDLEETGIQGARFGLGL